MTNQTRIQAMHAEWQRASEAYEANEGAEHDARQLGQAPDAHVLEAIKRLWRQMDHLASAILLMPPSCDLDAAIVALHLVSANELAKNFESISDKDADNALVAAQNLAAFLIDQASKNGRPGLLEGHGTDWCIKERSHLHGQFEPIAAAA